jgi:hypothetical protein
MKHFAEISCNVVFIPAHTSHVIQPLDCGVNSYYKQAIKESGIVFPKKKEMKTALPTFLRTLESAMEKALLSTHVIASFEKACIFLRPCLDILKDLPEMPTTFNPTPQTRFTLSGEIVTDPAFLAKWEAHEAAKGRKDKQQVKGCDDEARRGAEFRRDKRKAKDSKTMKEKEQKKLAKFSLFQSAMEGDPIGAEFGLFPEQCTQDSSSGSSDNNSGKKSHGKRRGIWINAKKKEGKLIDPETPPDVPTDSEYDEDGQSAVDIDLDKDEDAYPLTSTELEEITKKIVKRQISDDEKRKRKKPRRFEDDDYWILEDDSF